MTKTQKQVDSAKANGATHGVVVRYANPRLGDDDIALSYVNNARPIDLFDLLADNGREPDRDCQAARMPAALRAAALRFYFRCPAEFVSAVNTLHA